MAEQNADFERTRESRLRRRRATTYDNNDVMLPSDEARRISFSLRNFATGVQRPSEEASQGSQWRRAFHDHNLRRSRSEGLAARVRWSPIIHGNEVDSVVDLQSPNDYVKKSLSSDGDVVMILRRKAKTVSKSIGFVEHTFTIRILSAPSVQPIYLSTFTSNLWHILALVYGAVFAAHEHEDGESEVVLSLQHPDVDGSLESPIVPLTRGNGGVVITHLIDRIHGNYCIQIGKDQCISRLFLYFSMESVRKVSCISQGT